MHTDVLIVGAGPTGLMLANQLARRGIRVLIIDRQAAVRAADAEVGVTDRSVYGLGGRGRREQEKTCPKQNQYLHAIAPFEPK